MTQFSFGEKYRLEVHWSSINFKSEDLLELESCSLEGPVVSELMELSVSDSIRLDFVSQYITLLPEYIIASLSWEGVEYKDGKILLKNVYLRNKNIIKLPSIKDTDYLVIDTSDHEDEKHNYSVNYKTYLIKSDGESYNFRSN